MNKTYEEIGQDVGYIVTQKQAAYGDSFGKSGQIMRILYPQGIPLDKLDDALTVVRVLDKLFRVATDRDALGESPWSDIAGYSLLSIKRLQDRSSPPLAQRDLKEVVQEFKHSRVTLISLAVTVSSSEAHCKLCGYITALTTAETRYDHKKECLLYEGY